MHHWAGKKSKKYLVGWTSGSGGSSVVSYTKKYLVTNKVKAGILKIMNALNFFFSIGASVEPCWH